MPTATASRTESITLRRSAQIRSIDGRTNESDGLLALTALDKSMSPTIEPGDELIVRPRPDWARPGQIPKDTAVVVTLKSGEEEGEPVRILGRWCCEEADGGTVVGVTIDTDNSDYPAHELNAADIDSVARVIELRTTRINPPPSRG